jgi:hypothetical protein
MDEREIGGVMWMRFVSTLILLVLLLLIGKASAAEAKPTTRPTTRPDAPRRSTYHAEDRPGYDALKAYWPSNIGETPPPKPLLIFGELRWRPDEAGWPGDQVTVYALWFRVDRDEFYRTGHTTTKEYVLWTSATEAAVVRVKHPAIVEFYTPVEVRLIEREKGRIKLAVKPVNRYDNSPIQGEQWYELPQP